MVGATSEVKTANPLFDLVNLISNDKDFVDCFQSLSPGNGATFDSVWGSSCALLISALAEKSPLLVICEDSKRQDGLVDDLETFSDREFRRFPAFVSSIDSSVGVDFDYGDRLRLVKRLVQSDAPRIVLATVASLLQPTPTQDSITQHSRAIKKHQTLDLNSFQTWLVEHGFHRTSAVELPGEFASRGGIVDIFAPDWTVPVRIELFDDEVESIRYFHVSSQRSDQEIDQVEITLLSPEQRDAGHLTDFISHETKVIVLEPESLADVAKSFVARNPHPGRLYSWNEVRKQLAPFGQASISRLSAGSLENRYVLPVEPVEKFSGDIDEIRRELERVAGDGSSYIVARTEGELPRIREILAPTSIASGGRLKTIVGCVHEGFRIRGTDESSVLVVGADQLFHRSDLRRTSRRRRLGKAIDSFLDLREGDLVVHLSHGIGRFRGLKMLDKDGEHTEHLEVEFHGGTRIYVPASKIDLVQKYIGGTKTKPTLARIGGKAWVKQKAVAQQAVTDLAAEMIELQAARNARNGIAFGFDTQWQNEFEQSFPYRETPDQLTAIAAIKSDMQQPKPMDRLLCGDVGYGKTEVAMRAAFKAVENGYQVAVLVPTTILAEQHFKTFNERMIEFPLDIEKLSRFCSPRQIRESIQRLKCGQADIAIGTHRLVSKDVDFYNLGLVIIDEEQRFGVAHKERLKSLRSTVDVLTMSATPIPRTLHMSLVGVRDISNLETAPEERLAVETRVTRFDSELVRTVILRELSRGGQTFFLHNRVNDIQQMKQRLESIVPEARIVVGHGQMQEGDLEVVMTDFIAGKFDVLLATTIIESGLDIPNANTILINDADRFGLSDLHQLRGRVGRYKNRAYCYLLIEPQKHITPLAAKRLQAIETFSEMGAGFAISMRDLEIRGAGNLLGTEQSGHIAAIGYELYCQQLENAVRVLKKQPAKISIDIDIDLPLSAFLPDEYVPDRRQKIDLYRRLTRLSKFDDVEQFREELVDRFGDLPGPAKRLLQLAEIKLEAAVWQIQSVFIEDTYLGFRYQSRKRMEQLSKAHKGMIRLVDDKTAYLTLKKVAIPPTKMLALLKSLLQPQR